MYKFTKSVHCIKGFNFAWQSARLRNPPKLQILTVPQLFHANIKSIAYMHGTSRSRNYFFTFNSQAAKSSKLESSFYEDNIKKTHHNVCLMTALILKVSLCYTKPCETITPRYEKNTIMTLIMTMTLTMTITMTRTIDHNHNHHGTNLESAIVPQKALCNHHAMQNLNLWSFWRALSVVESFSKTEILFHKGWGVRI